MILHSDREGVLKMNVPHMCSHRSIKREVRNSSPTILNRQLGISEHPEDTAPPFAD